MYTAKRSVFLFLRAEVFCPVKLVALVLLSYELGSSERRGKRRASKQPRPPVGGEMDYLGV